MSLLIRSWVIGLAIAVASALGPGAGRSDAQVFGYGYPYGGYGVMGGWGMPGWGMAGFGPGYGYGYGWGYPVVAAPGFVNYGGYGPLMGGYYGAAPGPFGAYPPGWYNPATLSLGITPLAIQSALMERGLQGTTFEVPRAGGLQAGTYRIEPVRPGANAGPTPR